VSRLIWPLLVVAAIVTAAVVSSAGEETRTELEYLDEIRSQATSLSRSGVAIRDVMSRIRDIGRDEFTTLFDGVGADIDVAVEFVAEEPPTESLIPVWSLYRQTVQAWDDGVTNLASSILLAADNPGESAVVNVVGDALADLRAGDNLYKDLKVEFEREEIPDPVSPLVTVSLAPSEGGILSLSASYVAAARASTNGLGLRPGLKISQVLTDPQWQINVEAQPVVPATDTITFSTVITNSGNVESQPETVTMTLRGGEEPVVASVEVPALRPNAQTTVQFEPLPVVADLIYEVEMELVVSGPDSDRDDNIRRIKFTVNPA
jgi:hypothetical protein